MPPASAHKDFYRLGPALFFPEQPWHPPSAGASLYNQHDRDRAKRLMKEAGYAGQTGALGQPHGNTSSCTSTRWWPQQQLEALAS